MEKFGSRMGQVTVELRLTDAERPAGAANFRIEARK